jgi:hypothetical protein
MSHGQETNDLLKLVNMHRFHNPLQPKACELCRNEVFRQRNGPTARWSRAVVTALKPPAPVAVMLGLIAALAVALAVTLGA